MKIEAELSDELTLKYIYGPAMVDRGKWLKPGWLIYATSNLSPTYFGAFGIGDTLQAACDHALAQAHDHLARHPQGEYNVNAGPEIDLDLDFLTNL